MSLNICIASNKGKLKMSEIGKVRVHGAKAMSGLEFNELSALPSVARTGFMASFDGDIVLYGKKNGVQAFYSLLNSQEAEIAALTINVADALKGFAGALGDDLNFSTNINAKIDNVMTVAGSRIAFGDTRNVDDKPNETVPHAVTALFKYNVAAGNPPVTAHGLYSHILNIAGWDHGGSGGFPSQLSIGNGIAIRQAISGTEWGPWRKMATVTDVTNAAKQGAMFKESGGYALVTNVTLTSDELGTWQQFQAPNLVITLPDGTSVPAGKTITFDGGSSGGVIKAVAGQGVHNSGIGIAETLTIPPNTIVTVVANSAFGWYVMGFNDINLRADVMSMIEQMTTAFTELTTKLNT
jgi:hypothetical protein